MNPNHAIFRAGPAQLDALRAIEHACFTPPRIESDGVLRRSLSSSAQEVWMIDEPVAGAMVLRLYPKSLRILSVAVLPSARSKGLGKALLHFAIQRATSLHKHAISLEVDARDAKLQAWYHNFGFRPAAILEDYYDRGWHAQRMRHCL